MDYIVKAAVWSSGSVFARFYLRDFSKQSYNLSLMGPLVTAKKIVGGGRSVSPVNDVSDLDIYSSACTRPSKVIGYILILPEQGYCFGI